MDEVSDWSGLTVSELKEALKSRGLAVSGNKSELIERIMGDEVIEAEFADWEGGPQRDAILEASSSFKPRRSRSAWHPRQPEPLKGRQNSRSRAAVTAARRQPKQPLTGSRNSRSAEAFAPSSSYFILTAYSRTMANLRLLGPNGLAQLWAAAKMA